MDDWVRLAEVRAEVRAEARAEVRAMSNELEASSSVSFRSMSWRLAEPSAADTALGFGSAMSFCKVSLGTGADGRVWAELARFNARDDIGAKSGSSIFHAGGRFAEQWPAIPGLAMRMKTGVL